VIRHLGLEEESSSLPESDTAQARAELAAASLEVVEEHLDAADFADAGDRRSTARWDWYAAAGRQHEQCEARNGSNVAISRTRCLTVIYANPRLLEVSCGTIAQMEIVNGLCWVRAYSEEQPALVTAGDSTNWIDASIGSAVGSKAFSSLFPQAWR